LDVDFKWLEADMCGSIDSLRAKYPNHENMVRNLKFRVPRTAFRWLASLSNEEQANIRIATNRTLDQLFAQSELWTRYQSGGSLMSDTILAYPNACERMPAQIETISNYTRSIIDTKDFKGESGIGLAFEEFELNFDKDKKGNDVHIYIPKGKIEVIKNFPTMSSWHLIGGEEPSFLGEEGSKRFIKRMAEAWVGRIIRTYTNTLIFDWLNGGGQVDRLTLYACNVSKDKFGLLVQLPPLPEKKEEECGPKQIPLDYTPKQQPKKREFGPEMLFELKEIVAKRTLLYFRTPGRLDFELAPEQEVGEEFALVAKGDKKLQDKLREEVRKNVDWTLFQNCRNYTFDQFAKTFWKLCDALGIPNEFDTRKMR
jgi:hypothetical protein